MFFSRIHKLIKWQSATARFHMQSLSSTIFALSTNIKNTGSPIAVIRVSGPQSSHVVQQLTKKDERHFRDNARKVFLQNLYDNRSSELIDKAMVIWFNQPKSYTGEDMCEFHVHGSQAVIAKLLNVLATFPGCRHAEPGEFTKKGLINGKLQLVEVEGIHDLINSRTESQRKRALSALNTDQLTRTFEVWRKDIIQLMAHLEAYIDFSEDELIDPNVLVNLNASIAKMIEQISQHTIKSKQKSELIKDGLSIAIIGNANVGKSSLINKLSKSPYFETNVLMSVVFR